MIRILILIKSLCNYWVAVILSVCSDVSFGYAHQALAGDWRRCSNPTVRSTDFQSGYYTFSRRVRLVRGQEAVVANANKRVTV